MKKSKWNRGKKRVAKGLIPLFAPLMLTPVSAPLGSSNLKPDARKFKAKDAQYAPYAKLRVSTFEDVSSKVYEEMKLQDSGLRFEVFNKALIGYYNLQHEDKLSDKGIVTIVDFTKSSKEKRIWVVDVENKELLHNTYVAHGRNSGEEFAESFSNDNESFMSSIGFYVTQKTYIGKHGLSLKLEGMDEAFNTNALDRCIVMHGAEYANEDFIEQYGRLGRSLGCPALPMKDHEDIIDSIKGGTAMYIHAANDSYTSDYLDHANAMARLVQDTQPTLPEKQNLSI